MSQLWDKINYWIGRRPQGGLDRGFLENNRKTFMDRVGKLGGPESSAHQLATTLHEDIDEKIRGMHEYKMYHRKRFLFFQQVKIWLSCLTTISISLAALYKVVYEWNMIAIITSALVTTIALIERTHNHRDLWLLNANYCHRFCRLYNEFNDALLNIKQSDIVDVQIAKFRTKFLDIDTEFRRAMNVSYEDSASFDVGNTVNPAE